MAERHDYSDLEEAEWGAEIGLDKLAAEGFTEKEGCRGSEERNCGPTCQIMVCGFAGMGIYFSCPLADARRV